MYYIPLDKERYNAIMKVHTSDCEDNQKLFEFISNDIEQHKTTGIELNTKHLYKKVVRLGQQRLRSNRLHLANTFKLMETGDIKKDTCGLTEDEFKDLWQVVLESKKWYSKLRFLERRVNSVHIIPPKDPFIKEHCGTVLATLKGCSGLMDNLSDMLTLHQNH